MERLIEERRLADEERSNQKDHSLEETFVIFIKTTVISEYELAAYPPLVG